MYAKAHPKEVWHFLEGIKQMQAHGRIVEGEAIEFTRQRNELTAKVLQKTAIRLVISTCTGTALKRLHSKADGPYISQRTSSSTKPHSLRHTKSTFRAHFSPHLS